MSRGFGIVLGVLAGGLLGVVARPAVMYAFWLRGADADTTPILVFVSAGIGLVVGALAALSAAFLRGFWVRPVVGVASGAVLAYLASVLTFLPLFYGGLLGFGGIQAVDDDAVFYGAAMALTGAVSGGGGSLLQSWLQGARSVSARADVLQRPTRQS